MKRDFLEYAKNAKAQSGENYDPRAVSGVIMIAFKARKDEPDISDCLVAIRQTVEKVDKNNVLLKTGMTTTSTFSGAIDARKAGISTPPGSSQSSPYRIDTHGSDSPVSNFALYFEAKPLDKKFQVFELKLSPERGK